MQHPDETQRSADPLNHPEAGEWMAFLYGEVPAARRGALRSHLERCPECAARWRAWQSSRQALDTWRWPATGRSRTHWLPVARWAAAAALVLGLGFGFGRLASPATRQVAALEEGFRQLQAETARQRQADLQQVLDAATGSARAEALRLLLQAELHGWLEAIKVHMESAADRQPDALPAGAD